MLNILLERTIQATLLWFVVCFPVTPGRTAPCGAYLIEVKVRRNYFLDR